MRDINTDALAEAHYAKNDPQFQEEDREDYIQELQQSLDNTLEDIEYELDGMQTYIASCVYYIERLEDEGVTAEVKNEIIIKKLKDILERIAKL